jgi:hypothetical protein
MKAIFQIEHNKAPSPDRSQQSFINFYDIIKSYLVDLLSLSHARQLGLFLLKDSSKNVIPYSIVSISE